MKLGIDLHNVRDGGGVSYTTNLLAAFDPQRHGFAQIHVFGAEAVLARLPDRPCIIKHSHPLLARSLPHRLRFLFFHLTDQLRAHGCSMLYSPGGLYFGGFRPFATISRNMMPYETQHWAMYPLLSFDRLRLVLFGASGRNHDVSVTLGGAAPRLAELRSSAGSGFGFVESIGLMYGAKLLADSLPSTAETARWEDTGLDADAARARPRLPHDWNADEAASVFARAHTIVCHEPHSPIIALANGTPIIHTYSEFHSPKCWMFKDIGLGEWLLEMDETPVETMAKTLFAIDADYPAAQGKVKRAMAYVHECFGKSMKHVKGVLAEQ